MHEDAPVLNATPRERTGTRYAVRLRQAGGLPAVVYGHGEAPLAVSVDAKETVQMLHKGEKVFLMRIDGHSDQNVIVKDLQFDYLGTNVVHADFARVDLEERIEVNVPIHLVGEAAGLRTAGAILMHPTNEIQIECKVANLPDSLDVDVSHLKAGDVIHASDIELPLDTMKLLSDPDTIIAQIVVQAELPESEEETEVSGSEEPEVITERKEEDEDED